jgi:uncharacterized protein with von Willebrand factor type A (vWA) domain
VPEHEPAGGPAEREELAVRAVVAGVGALAAELRARGVRVGVGEVLQAHRALAAVELPDAERALRATLCSRREDLAAFDAAWRSSVGAGGRDALAELSGVSAALPRIADPDAGAHEVDELPVPVPAAWSREELLRDRDLADLTSAEAREVEALVARMVLAGPWRRTRRLRRARRGARLDVRGTVAAATRTGGVPLQRRWRAPATEARALVLVADVSGSMTPYARALLALAEAAVRTRPRVEAFAFGTRLTRLTLDLRTGGVDAAVARAQDWSGGTRIGEALAQLNREHGRRLGRGAVVVLLSDGWDRGDPDLLGAEMARLRRCAHRVVWVNPLSAAPGFEPLTRGLVAALPHADVVRSGHSLRALEALVQTLEDMR